jgi:hypothetical protein
VNISLLWEPRDMWVGLYWQRICGHTLLYICLIPCLPIRIDIG